MCRVRAKCYVSRASEVLCVVCERSVMSRARVKILVARKMLSPQFSSDQNRRSRATHSTSLARECVLCKLLVLKSAYVARVQASFFLCAFADTCP